MVATATGLPALLKPETRLTAVDDVLNVTVPVGATPVAAAREPATGCTVAVRVMFWFVMAEVAVAASVVVLGT